MRRLRSPYARFLRKETFDLSRGNKNRPKGGCVSGRKDLNLRPLGPEPSALAGLSHSPNERYYTLIILKTLFAPL